MEPYPHQFATALFSFLYHLASYDAGGEALVSCGMMEALLKVGGSPFPFHFLFPHSCIWMLRCLFWLVVNYVISLGDQVPWGRAGPDYLRDTGSESCGSHHQSGHGCISVSWWPLNLYLQAGGTESSPQMARSSAFSCVDCSFFALCPFVD